MRIFAINQPAITSFLTGISRSGRRAVILIITFLQTPDKVWLDDNQEGGDVQHGGAWAKDPEKRV
jgi:hypothetical protein